MKAATKQALEAAAGKEWVPGTDALARAILELGQDLQHMEARAQLLEQGLEDARKARIRLEREIGDNEAHATTRLDRLMERTEDLDRRIEQEAAYATGARERLAEQVVEHRRELDRRLEVRRQEAQDLGYRVDDLERRAP